MMKTAAALMIASANAWQGGYDEGWGFGMDPYAFVGFDEFGFSAQQSPYDYGYESMPQWADPWGSSWNMAQNDPWFGKEMRSGAR